LTGFLWSAGEGGREGLQYHEGHGRMRYGSKTAKMIDVPGIAAFKNQRWKEI